MGVYNKTCIIIIIIIWMTERISYYKIIKSCKPIDIKLTSGIYDKYL